MKVDYCCSSADRRVYDQYYANQAGGEIPFFHGARVQRGHGIGNIFASIARFAMPILRRMAPVVGRKILQTGVKIAGDVAAGQSVKDAAKTRIVDAFNEGINKIIPAGDGQSGSGKRRRRRRRPQPKKTTTTKSSKKRKLIDIFA